MWGLVVLEACNHGREYRGQYFDVPFDIYALAHSQCVSSNAIPHLDMCRVTHHADGLSQPSQDNLTDEIRVTWSGMHKDAAPLLPEATGSKKAK
jgi:hypothetical protein